MNNSTSSTPGSLTSSEIILVTTTVLTGLISLLDLFVNTYIGYKKRHFTSSCCQGFCKLDYNSESDEQLPK